MWPMRISLSDAPWSYFFCASAAGLASAAASRAAIGTSTRFMESPPSLNGVGSWFPRLAIVPLPGQPRQAQADGPRDAHRHQVGKADEKQAENRPGGGFRDFVRDVRHELDEQRAVERARNRGEPADDDADEERKREENVEAVGRHELDRYRAQRPRHTGKH